MPDQSADAFADLLAARIRTARNELTARWLERIAARIALDPERVFPTDTLLDHMPLLVTGIADAVADPDAMLSAHSAVIDRARELGTLRFSQGFSEHELQKEYELLGGVLFSFLRRVAAEHTDDAWVDHAFAIGHRLFQAIALVQQATTAEFVRHATAELREREERLQAFHQALTHEIRNRIGATLGAGQLLALDELDASARADLAAVVVRNAEGMRVVLDNLLELARTRVAPRQQRHVHLREAVAEAVRQLREAAERAQITVRVGADLPTVDVNAAAVELCLVNYLANAIKYADPTRAERWVEVSGRLVGEQGAVPSHVRLEVVDNGLGVPVAARARLFERFFRAHEGIAPSVDGSGLGLSIVRDVAESLGGSVSAEFPDEGSVFVLTVPARRAEDVAAVLHAPLQQGAQRDGPPSA